MSKASMSMCIYVEQIELIKVYYHKHGVNEYVYIYVELSELTKCII